MPLELVNMENATPFDRLRLVLVGKEKTGKSRLAATGRKGVLVLDVDGRRESLAGMKGVRCATLVDQGNINMQPTAFNDAVTLLAKLEAKRSFTHLGFKNVKPEEDIIRTVVVDSIYSIAKCAERFAKYSSEGMRRTLQLGHMKVWLTNGWDSWNAEVGLVEQYIFRLLAIPDIDIILIFHEDDEEAPGSSVEKRIYTGRFEPYPARYGNVIKYFNELWRVTRVSAGAPKIQFVPDYQFTASTNLGINTSPEADIEKLINNYLAKNPALPGRDSGVLQLPSEVVNPIPIKGVV